MDPLTLLQDLIALPSVNPMGRCRTGPEFLEGRVSDYIENFFRALGVAWQRIEVLPGRANLVARIDLGGATSTILLDAHQDTVPVDGMTIPPFVPAVRDGRISGRGACDVKGGLAAMLAAFARLARERPAGGPHVVMTCTCDEESTQLGVSDLVRQWTDPARRGSLLKAPPQAAIVAEPTDLDVVVAHRGATRWKLRTTGRACHSSDPTQGVNAIYRMGRVLQVLEHYAAELPRGIVPHPLCGPATLSVGRIEGGLSVNTVPDRCEIEIDRRVIPGEDAAAVIGQVAEFLRARVDFDVEMLPPWILGLPLADTENAELADRLLRHVAEVAGPRRKVGVPYGTHASRFAAAGVPSVVFGPGSIRQAHTPDEWLSIDELYLASEVYYRFCRAPFQ